LLRKKEEGLVVDIIATRDIKPGEEIFIDYGNDWSNAWKEHVDNWKASPEVSNAYPRLMNDDKYFRTLYEIKDNPYPANITTLCLFREEHINEENFMEQWKDDEFYMSEHMIIGTRDVDAIISRHHIDGSFVARLDIMEEMNYWPCHVYRRSEDGNTYLVRILQSPVLSDTWWTEAQKPIFLANFSKDHIFFHESYSADQFLPNAFRHFIGIPDDIYPKSWQHILEETMI